MTDPFALVGPRHSGAMGGHADAHCPMHARLRGMPWLSACVLAVIIGGCLLAPVVSNHDPSQFYLDHLNQPPGYEFYFGTDSLGRDIYSIIWHGGRTSLFIGFLSTAIITVIGIVYGCISGIAAAWLDSLLMRIVELLQSIPNLLILLLVVSVCPGDTSLRLSIIIGCTGWFSLARLVRSEVRQIRNSEYIIASRCMGASFAHLLLRHLLPNFLSAVFFVIVSTISTGIAMESTLSFLGLGLPVDVLSWGSMLSLADRALLTNTWWVVVIPGAFLITTLFCINSVASHFRREANKRSSNI